MQAKIRDNVICECGKRIIAGDEKMFKFYFICEIEFGWSKSIEVYASNEKEALDKVINNFNCSKNYIELLRVEEILDKGDLCKQR